MIFFISVSQGNLKQTYRVIASPAFQGEAISYKGLLRRKKTLLAMTHINKGRL